MKSSVPLNLYEQILKKGGRVTVDGKTIDEQKREFADFLVKWAKGT
jgi:predicted kinase